MLTIVTHDGGRIDAPRRQPRVLIRVDVLPLMKVAGGVLWERGKQIGVVYRKDFDRIKAQIEDAPEHQIEAARRTVETSYQQWLNENTNGARETPRYNRDTMPFSVEAAFYAITGRGIKPFRSAEILENLPPPVREDVLAGDPAIGVGDVAIEIAASCNVEVDEDGNVVQAQRTSTGSKKTG